MVTAVPALALHPISLHLAHSAARVHPAGDPVHGRPVPGQVRHGQDGRLRAGDASTARAAGGAGAYCRAEAGGGQGEGSYHGGVVTAGGWG